jgi:hypothetical protein
LAAVARTRFRDAGEGVTALPARAAPLPRLATVTSSDAAFFAWLLRAIAWAAPFTAFAGAFACVRRAVFVAGAAFLADAARLAGAFLAVAIMPPAW